MRTLINFIFILFFSQWAVAQGKYTSINPYSEGYAVAYYNGGAVCLDKNGKEVFDKYRDIKSASDGFIAVKDGSGKWGFIDKNGKLIIDFQYDDVGSFYEGLSWVKKFGKYGFIDKNNELVILFHYTQQPGDFSEGLVAVPDIGFINKEGETVIGFQGMKKANSFKEGFSGVQLKDGKWIAIDKLGKQIGKEKYDDLKPFSEGLAAVRLNYLVYGYINTTGDMVIEPTYYYAGDFKGGVANVQFLDSRWLLIDKTNKTVHVNIAGKADYFVNIADKANYSESLIAFSYFNKLGYADLKGNMKIPPVFSEAGNFSEGLAVVKIDGIWGVINKEGLPVTEDIKKSLTAILNKLNSEGKEIIWIDKKTYDYSTFGLAAAGGITFELRRKGRVEDTYNPTEAFVLISETEVLDPGIIPEHYDQLKARLLKDLEKEGKTTTLAYDRFYFTDIDLSEQIEEKLATFPGGEQALRQYIAKNMKYPAEAAERGVQGRVVVKFVIGPTGQIRDAEIVQSVDPLLDAEAKRLVLSMPRWNPGTINGKPVSTGYSMPLIFSLK
ncbi:MAG: TonB family protein [Prevotellaceae bacterium]|jgi:TonB family protein|nr:TonB family protein [Prevotellaceae bacterium]